MSWASDSNAFVCTEVMPSGVSAVEDTDLSGTYYTKVLPTIKLQIAKAGYRLVCPWLWGDRVLEHVANHYDRLAAWLNLIATGETGL